jgi:glycosyltransferase involved in cell wall biosynthesis
MTVGGPDVTVVIPTRDRPRTLAAAVVSACGQDEVDVEAVVVDDGDETGTEEVVEAIGDPRVRLIRSEGPPGVAAARNAGIDAARGRWIAFLDDDDAWAPTKLAEQLAAVQRTGATWAYTGYVTVDPTMRVRGGHPPASPGEVVRALRQHNAVPAGGSSVVVRRDALDAAGRFDPSLITSEDWDLWLRLAEVGSLAGVPRPLVALREHGAMASRRIERMLTDVEIVAHRHRLPVDRARHVRWAAWMRLEEGDVGGALRLYARAVRHGDLASLGRAGIAAVRPGMARRARRPADPAWAEEGQRWCDDLRRRLRALALPEAEVAS